jgi:hypothetical protein
MTALLWVVAVFFQSIVIPSQIVPLPASSLPVGMTYSTSGGLVVAGPITATQITLTGGPTLPACASNLYLFQYSPTTKTLTPVCYAPVVANTP